MASFTVSSTQSLPGELYCPICKLCTEATVDISPMPGLGLRDRDRLRDKPIICAAHGPLLFWVRQSFQEEIDHMYTQGIYRAARGWRPYCFGFSRGSGRQYINYFDYKNRPRFSRELLLSTDEGGSKPGIRKNSLDPKWIDLQIASRWIDSCIKRHGSRCSNTFNTPPCSPAYLIDTKGDCILQPDNEELDYVALSYRWGNQAGFRTNKISVVRLKVEGSLCTTEGIPPTIRHAMHIVRSIGERYLWVDSICLISDDEKHLTEQLQLMGSIYARAKLTIVATDGDAWDGLHGIREAPGAPGKSRDLSNTFSYPNGVQITVRDHPSLSQLRGSASEYFQRGWTYQEYYLSQRRLIFGKKQMHWSCSCATWHEDNPGSEDDSDQKTEGQDFRIPNILSGKPDLEELETLASEYHARDFTRPDDALPGFIGLSTILTRTFKGGFLCGHPETWFDATLMWQWRAEDYTAGGYSRRPTLERRRIAEHTSTLPGAVLPSWSWIGWKGNKLRLLGDEEDFALPQGLMLDRERDLLPRWRYITTPITEWYSHETPTSSKRRIQSFPQLYNVDGSLGDSYQGWFRETYDPSRHPLVFAEDQSKFIGKSVFQHPTIPHAYFWAPFPSFGVGQGTSISPPKQHQYISCHTKRGWFGVTSSGPDFKVIEKHSFDAQVALTDDQGRECGWLQVAPSDEIRPLLYAQGRRQEYRSDTEEAGAKSLSELKIELVAVCQRRRSCPCWPWTGGRCNCGNELYGVLWVEWVDGVAYRRACGYVVKEMWESHKLEDVDLVLG